MNIDDANVPCRDQGHLFAMEVSSGEEYYIASDNTGTPLAVFSSNGQMIKQVGCLGLSPFPVDYFNNSNCRGMMSAENTPGLDWEPPG